MTPNSGQEERYFFSTGPLHTVVKEHKSHGMASSLSLVARSWVDDHQQPVIHDPSRIWPRTLHVLQKIRTWLEAVSFC